MLIDNQIKIKIIKEIEIEKIKNRFVIHNLEPFVIALNEYIRLTFEWFLSRHFHSKLLRFLSKSVDHLYQVNMLNVEIDVIETNYLSDHGLY